MKSRFQPEPEADSRSMFIDPEAIDPEAFDASEQQFAASLETSRPKFIVDPETRNMAASSELAVEPSSANPAILETHAEALMLDSAIEPPLVAEQRSAPTPEVHDPEAWRNEVSARLNRYRSKRKTKEPRYPSLRLKFEPMEPAWSNLNTATAPDVDPEDSDYQKDDRENAFRISLARETMAAEPAARIIPFRRASVPPPRPLDELAEPVFLAPRILEAPEIAPPRPALGGILMEAVEEAPAEKRPGLEIPLQPAAMSQRLLAVGTDLLLVGLAVALFGYVFFRTTAATLPAAQIAIMAIALAAILWPAYQYAVLVYSGATPGLKLAKLRLARFDGTAVPRRLRRWRVLATALSGISLGLGYAWCILDEDQLCWHDRITGTYMAPKDGS